MEVDGPPKGQDQYVGLWKLPLQQTIDCSETQQFSAGGTTMFSCVKWGNQTS